VTLTQGKTIDREEKGEENAPQVGGEER